MSSNATKSYRSLDTEPAMTGSLTFERNGQSYVTLGVLGRGAFGVVYKARRASDNAVVAIKRVRQDPRFKNRELQILRELKHKNIVNLIDSFLLKEGEEVFLHLVMEYMPETIHAEAKSFTRARQRMPIICVQLYIYQLARALAYIHSMGTCHRDIKPHNLLVDSQRGVLKVCDFGSAKNLQPGEESVAYICSRFYRAPELIINATKYSTAIDVWSMGCVLGELLVGQPLFQGKNSLGQLVEIVKILGTPTAAQVEAMNKDNKGEVRFSTHRDPKEWESVLGSRASSEVVDLLSDMLCYEPSKRISPLEVCAHPFFDDLREPGASLPDKSALPELFDFSVEELQSVELPVRLALVPPAFRDDFPSSMFE